MERIYIDFVGPTVRSRRGNVVILVLLGGFSKFVAMYPVRKIIAAAVISRLVGRYCSSYGVPSCIVSDNAALLNSRCFNNIVTYRRKAGMEPAYTEQLSTFTPQRTTVGNVA
jgi:hypothetical protein